MNAGNTLAIRGVTSPEGGDFTLKAGLLAIVFLLCASVPVHAQYQLVTGAPLLDSYPTIEIPFEVLDNTAAVDSLTASDFMVFEDGVRMLPLEIECGDMQIASKIYFYFLIDVSYSMGFMEDTTLYDPDSVKWRTAKQVFIDAFSRLRPQDEGALGSFAYTFRQEQPFTSDTRKLVDAASGMELRSGTSIYDAIEIASALSAEKQGKKVIVLLTDGVDNGSRLTREQAISLAWRRGVPVYPIGLGFYKDPDQPWRVDEDTLRRIAEGTGGKAFFAPTSEDLSQIFSDIIESIYSIGCVLRYVTPDTCRDGAQRSVEIQADIEGMLLTERVAYRLPDLRSRLLLSLQLPSEALQAGRRYSIPVIADGEVRPGEPMSFSAELRYDPDLITVLGTATSASVLDGDMIDIEILQPGVVRISAADILPRRGIPYDSDELFSLDVEVASRSSVAALRFAFEVTYARQVCQMIATATTAETMVHACPTSVVLGFDTTIVAIPGQKVEVPILLESPIDFNQSLEYSIHVDYDASLFTYDGFSTAGSISQDLDVSVFPLRGALEIRAGEGLPDDTSGVLLYLSFVTAMQKVGQPVAFQLRSAFMRQRGIGIIASDCVPDITLVGHRLYTDGLCVPLLRRRPGLQLSQNSPNPVSADGGQTTFEFTVTGEAPARMEIIDEFGRRCALLVDGFLPKGRHSAVWRPDNLPSGVYLCVLREGNEIRTRKVLLAR